MIVAHADFNCLKLPGVPGDQWGDDFLLLSDVFPTAFHATELAYVGAGKTVAVFGAGPVGLLSAYSSLLKSASEAYVVANVTERLSEAEGMGAVAVGFGKGDPVEQIDKLRKVNQAMQQALRPAEEKMKDVDSAIDAVGYQARDDENPSRERAPQVLENCLRVLNPTGSLGMIGVYIAADPGAWRRRSGRTASIAGKAPHRQIRPERKCHRERTRCAGRVSARMGR